MIITEQMRSTLKKNLPKGYAAIIAERTGCSEATVYNVLNGRDNEVVALAIIDLAEETKLKRELARQKVQQL